jgi:hypothetical protein
MVSLPLVSVAQNIFSLVVARFPPQYARYLQDGSQSQEGVFVEVVECGAFQLHDPSDFTLAVTLIVALYLWLQSNKSLSGERTWCFYLRCYWGFDFKTTPVRPQYLSTFFAIGYGQSKDTHRMLKVSYR